MSPWFRASSTWGSSQNFASPVGCCACTAGAALRARRSRADTREREERLGSRIVLPHKRSVVAAVMPRKSISFKTVKRLPAGPRAAAAQGSGARPRYDQREARARNSSALLRAKATQLNPRRRSPLRSLFEKLQQRAIHVVCVCPVHPVQSAVHDHEPASLDELVGPLSGRGEWATA